MNRKCYKAYDIHGEYHKDNGKVKFEEYWLYDKKIPKNEIINEWDNKDDLKNVIICIMEILI